jgi:hypothetical protein
MPKQQRAMEIFTMLATLNIRKKPRTTVSSFCDVTQQTTCFTPTTNDFNRGSPTDSFFILPEKFFTLYETLMTGRVSPFIDRFAEISLRIFESGIKQYWKTLMHQLTDEIDLTQISIIKEDYLLKMGDLKYVFYIWAIGLLLASIAFALELLCHKYHVYIRRMWIMRMIRRLTWVERSERRERLMIIRFARVRVRPFIL